MAIITKTIGTAVGRDYSTIAGWIAGQAGNFVTSDTIQKGVCYPDSVFNEVFTISGATVNSTHYWWLTCSVKNNGIVNAGVVLDRLNATGTIAYLFDQYSIFDYMELRNIKTTNDNINYFVRFALNSVMDSLLIHGCSTGDTQRPCGIGTANSSTTNASLVKNCMVYGFVNVWAARGIALGDAGLVEVYNNTVFNLENQAGGSSIGFEAGSRTNNIVKNNLALTVETACFTGTWGTATNNESSDATAPGTSAIINATAANEITNTVSGSEDLHLKSGAQAINAGATIASFSADISGNSRPQGASWDIGADEFITTTSIKTIDGLVKASVKTVDGLAIASVKTRNGLE